jgi:hypothetical protein
MRQDCERFVEAARKECPLRGKWREKMSGIEKNERLMLTCASESRIARAGECNNVDRGGINGH